MAVVQSRQNQNIGHMALLPTMHVRPLRVARLRRRSLSLQSSLSLTVDTT
jgi:hypothetical protein